MNALQLSTRFVQNFPDRREEVKDLEKNMTQTNADNAASLPPKKWDTDFHG